MIRLEDIHVTFNRGTPLENEVLKGINLTVETGSFTTIIGGNGAGKSTLMNILAGDIRADSGKIFLDEVDVTRQKTESRAKYVSRVFQDPMLGTCATLSIEENLAMAYTRGKKRSLGLALSNKQRVLFKDLLAHLGIGLENRLKDPMGALSGGQRQAVSLLMATMQPSKVLLLDEHTAALDPKMARLVLKLTDQLVNEHKLTALMITHSMVQALDHGDRTIVMHQGQIVKDMVGEERSAMEPSDLLAMFDY